MKILTVKKNSIVGMLLGSSDEPVKIVVVAEAPKPAPPAPKPNSTTIVEMLKGSTP